MHKSIIYHLGVAALALLAAVSPAVAVPATVSTGQVVDLSLEQLDQLKHAQGIAFFPYKPDKLITGKLDHWVYVKIPPSLGGGFLFGSAKTIEARLNAAGVTEFDSVPPELQLASTPNDPPAAWPYPVQVQLELSNAYREDDLKWNIAGNLNGSDPNVLSELSWDDLKIYQLKFQLKSVMSKIFYFRGSVAYGWIFDGEVQDSDYSGDNRTMEWSRSNSDGDDGDVVDASAGIGYPFLFGRKVEVGIRPLVGYSYHEQNLKITNGQQTLSDPALAPPGVTPPPLGPIAGLDSSYEAKWKGPWIGLELNLRAPQPVSWIQRLESDFGFEYHWADYEAQADWNLRPDLASGNSFEHSADGDGFVFTAGLKFFFNRNWAVSGDFTYQDWQTDEGTDKVNYADGTSQATQLNEVKWTSTAVGLGIVYRF
jgi:Protochlamydia outer membrane protein